VRGAHERRQVRAGEPGLVEVERRNSHFDVEVGDDGVGSADFHSGSGLQGLRDRVAAVGGVLRMTSRPGAGTVLRAQLPVDVQQS
jgi:signal transduction histidine kinase